ncbi:acyl-CoA dehydrogenase family protein [Streptomyces huasconensis]|uniref:acyl-CoA dehydrogenase family protein n=1 Tax=Streptomyces huasconensis TaxID=1854574 RepID=UPI0033C1CC37
MTAPAEATEDAPERRIAAALGALTGPGLPFSAAGLAALDRAEAFPAEACRVLDAQGLPGFYVPAEHGGALSDFHAFTRVLRAVAAQDLTVALAHGKTYLGAVSTWLAGTPEQARALGERVASGAVVSCALTERHHGSDLLAGEVTAARDGDDWVLHGEKWLINNATRADLVTVLARTAPEGGPRGFSLLLVDKAHLAPGTYRCAPKVSTYGIRGMDISGISFDGARVPASALVGRDGQGVEIILKALHLTRTACAALSLGGGDRALRLATRFAAATRHEGRPLTELPHPRRLVGEAVASLALAEAAGTVAARSIQALTGEMSVVSAIAKAYVPMQVDEAIALLVRALGPYGLLAEAPEGAEETDRGAVFEHGAFAKVERDHRIIGIFDGSSLVNRSALIDQFPRLARAYRTGRVDEPGLTRATTLTAPLAPLDPDALSLLSRRGSTVVTALPQAVTEVEKRAARGEASPELAELARRLGALTAELHADLDAYTPSPHAVPEVAFTYAERYELCFAAASALHLWLRNAPRPGGELLLRGALVKALTAWGAPVDLVGADALYDRLGAAPAGPSEAPQAPPNHGEPS